MGSQIPFQSFNFLCSRNTQTWSELPKTPGGKRLCQAGYVTYPDGKQGILAAGGSSVTAHFLDLDTLIWEPKQSLPIPIYIGASVPYQDSFLIVGGHIAGEGSDLDTIYYYNPSTDNWDLIGTMTVGRREFAAFLVPDSFANCS